MNEYSRSNRRVEMEITKEIQAKEILKGLMLAMRHPDESDMTKQALAMVHPQVVEMISAKEAFVMVMMQSKSEEELVGLSKEEIRTKALESLNRAVEIITEETNGILASVGIQP